MKTITNYIFEKFRINKDTELYSSDKDKLKKSLLKKFHKNWPSTKSYLFTNSDFIELCEHIVELLIDSINRKIYRDTQEIIIELTASGLSFILDNKEGIYKEWSKIKKEEFSDLKQVKIDYFILDNDEEMTKYIRSLIEEDA